MINQNLSLLFALLLIPQVAKAGPMVELYTSQGCYSCPPADEFLGELLEARPDVVALEFHVDYWDRLRYGSAGVWKDPFSNPEYTARQRLYYSAGLSGTTGVYTPQMIINGSTAEIGSSRESVLRAINEKASEIDLSASIKNNHLSVDINGDKDGGTTLWLAIFDRIHRTEVPRGENHGKSMVNHHVVRELVSLGQWQGKKASNTFLLPDSAGFAGVTADEIKTGNRSCAVYLQDDVLGKVLGATYCDAI